MTDTNYSTIKEDKVKLDIKKVLNDIKNLETKVSKNPSFENIESLSNKYKEVLFKVYYRQLNTIRH